LVPLIGILYIVIEELKKDYAFNMATLKQLIFLNQRIMDSMARYGKGALSLEEYFIS